MVSGQLKIPIRFRGQNRCVYYCRNRFLFVCSCTIRVLEWPLLCVRAWSSFPITFIFILKIHFWTHFSFILVHIPFSLFSDVHPMDPRGCGTRRANSIFLSPHALAAQQKLNGKHLEFWCVLIVDGNLFSYIRIGRRRHCVMKLSCLNERMNLLGQCDAPTTEYSHQFAQCDALEDVHRPHDKAEWMYWFHAVGITDRTAYVSISMNLVTLSYLYNLQLKSLKELHARDDGKVSTNIDGRFRDHLRYLWKQLAICNVILYRSILENLTLRL